MFVDTSNGVHIAGPPIVIVGNNVTIKCSASKNKYLNDIKWIHHSVNNEESPISINDGECKTF